MVQIDRYIIQSRLARPVSYKHMYEQRIEKFYAKTKIHYYIFIVS